MENSQHQPAPPPPEATAIHAQAIGDQGASVQRHSHVGIVVAVLAASLLAGGVSGVAGAYLAYRYLPVETRDPRTQQVEILGDSTEEVVAAAVPSVVNIAVSSPGTSGGLPEAHPDVPAQGEGSGVAYREAPDGGTYIITNNHVIEGATEIIVTGSDGESYPAELVGGDSESDIAVLLVQTSFPLIKLGDPDEVIVGQLAIAIGSPFGLQASVTAGVVSATHRPLTDLGGDNGEYPYVDSIQTDAAINPGNSGGALVNRRGELIGIPSVIYTDTGVSDGVGLAIPIDRATLAADQLIETGRVETPFLGVLGQTVTPDLMAQENLPVERGAYVVETTPGTEAERAGLQPGDVIVGVDEDRIRSMDDLILSVRRRAVGDEVTLRLWRDGEELELSMKVGAKPPAVEAE